MNEQKLFPGLDQTDWILIGTIILILLVGYVIFQASINHKELVFGVAEIAASIAA